MELITELERLADVTRGGTAMCIGMFDGVHRGHQLLLAQVREHAAAQGLRSLVFTFPDHPLSLLAPPYAPLLLSSAAEKARLIAAAGIDLCAMVPFTTEFAAMPAQTFLEEVVAGQARARYLACGDDFHFGARGQGDVDLLQREAPRLGLAVEVFNPLLEDDNPIKSTRIRLALLEGKVEEAARLLGRPYLLDGQVIEGDRRGRTIGYPTANLEPAARRLTPHDGVYAVRAWVGDYAQGGDRTRDGRAWNAMMNIGHRPTFQGTRRSLEAHLFDFSGDLYGQPLEIEFVAWVREERKFSSVEALIAQLREDEAVCRRRLGGGPV